MGWKAELAWFVDPQRTPYPRSGHTSTIDEGHMGESPPVRDRRPNHWSTAVTRHKPISYAICICYFKTLTPTIVSLVLKLFFTFVVLLSNIDRCSIVIIEASLLECFAKSFRGSFWFANSADIICLYVCILRSLLSCCFLSEVENWLFEITAFHRLPVKGWRKQKRSLRNISSDASSPTAAGRLFKAHFQSFVVP